MTHRKSAAPVRTQMPAATIPKGYRPAPMPSMPKAVAPKTTTFDGKAPTR